MIVVLGAAACDDAEGAAYAPQDGLHDHVRGQRFIAGALV
jgi:hypothetical protein